jgi:mannose-6-phosphate isomerase-like protein (cupin superfamily)
MNRVAFGFVALSSGVVLGLAAGIAASQATGPRASAIISQAHTKQEQFGWGKFYTYFEGESFSAKNDLAAVAVIKPGEQIHPPHQHADEEYLMVISGEGTWTLKDQTKPAHAGDVLYAAPWDLHGIANTGKTPLTFVVWKWTSKGMEAPAAPANSTVH